jgi:signal transduction histidine kinase
MPYRFKHSPHRPPWWPEDEEWPPVRGRMHHKPYFRRMGCAFALFNLFVLAIVSALVLSVAHALGLIQFSTPILQWSATLGVLALIPIVAIIAIVAAIVFGLRRLSTPLDELLAAADRVAEGDYSARVVEKGPREIRSLARTFNNMAERLHETDEKRRNLLADVTHELRTPLTVIQGNLEGMLDGVYAADETNLRSLLDETNLLSRLVEDLRTLALAESGALKLRKEPTDLTMLARDAAAAFQSQAETTGVALTVETADDIPWLDVDPGRIRQVLSNLLANALRYTPAGGSICVKVGMDSGHILLDVADTGPGIPTEDLPHIFERFYKSTDSGGKVPRDSGGMGLGLAIAKHLISAHAGTISAESSPGSGTTIHISLPFDK